MMDLSEDNLKMREKIRLGLDLTFKKLVDYKTKNDRFLVFSDNGKIVKVQAKDIKL